MPPYRIILPLGFSYVEVPGPQEAPALDTTNQETIALEGVDNTNSALCSTTGELCPARLDLIKRYGAAAVTCEVPSEINPTLNVRKLGYKLRENGVRAKKEGCPGPQVRDESLIDVMSGNPYDLSVGSQEYVDAMKCPTRESMNKDPRRQDIVTAYRIIAGAARTVRHPAVLFKKDTGATENS